MEKVYSEVDLNDAYLTLSDEQKLVLDNYVKRGMKTKWLNAWAMKKGAVLTSEELEDSEKTMERLLDWVLLDYEDSLTINPNTRCQCGKALRYRYTVLDKKTGQVYKLGKVHFAQHTGLSPEMVRLIMKGLKEIDLEREEILSKVISAWSLSIFIPSELDIPKDIQEQLQVKLPLLDRQESRLWNLVKKYYSDKYPVKKKKEMSVKSKTAQTLNQNTNKANKLEIAVGPDISNVQPSILYDKIKSLNITEEEAKQLFYFIQSKPMELKESGIKLEDIQTAATRALGRIGNPHIRKWLVEIECLFL
jgi:hypothetical protein